MKAYPTDGGYTEGMNSHDTYHSWAAAQYKEKVRVALHFRAYTNIFLSPLVGR